MKNQIFMVAIFLVSTHFSFAANKSTSPVDCKDGGDTGSACQKAVSKAIQFTSCKISEASPDKGLPIYTDIASITHGLLEENNYDDIDMKTLIFPKKPALLQFKRSNILEESFVVRTVGQSKMKMLDEQSYILETTYTGRFTQSGDSGIFDINAVHRYFMIADHGYDYDLRVSVREQSTQKALNFVFECADYTPNVPKVNP